MQVAVQRLSAVEFHRLAPQAVELYLQAMGYPHTIAPTRTQAWRAATSRTGFHSIAAFAIAPQTTRLAGIAYGSTGQPHDWWARHVRAGLAATGQDAQWLENYFELSEIHVAPQFQGRGVGHQLLEQLESLVRTPAILLSTPEVAGEHNAAFHLYRAHGYKDVLRHYTFPGDHRPFAILGKKLTQPHTNTGT